MRLVALLPLLLLASCRGYETPNKPLPPFKATTIQGDKLDQKHLAGHPALIALWVPG